MKKTLFLILASMSLLVFVGCSKDKKDDDGGPKSKNMKFTITTSGLQAPDNFDVLFAGGDAQGTATTMFKVNGVVQNNQRSVEISKEQMMAGTVIIETTTPLFTVAVTYGGFSGTEGHTFDFKLEPVIDGVAKPAVTKTIGTDTYSSQNSY